MKRRDFIKRSVQAGALIPLASGGLMARPLTYHYFPRPAGTEGRILVLINLNGGNDGLNTVVPFQDQVYYDSRRDIRLAQGQTLPLTDGLGLHGSLTGIHNLYGDGNCAVLNNVGYPDQNRSHFRSTDIWHTASDAEEVLFTGWLGRYLQRAHPDYPTVLPEAPFALQISASTSLALLGENGNMGIALDNPEQFFRLANGLEVEPTPVPDTKAGPELEYVRNIIEQSNTFSRKVNDAIIAGQNYGTYQTDSLSTQLKVVARLINGGLPTSVYIVSLGGFDTHSNQTQAHAQLLDYFSRGVASFLQDMAGAGNGNRVVCMSYSEFGRRLNQNGSNGTDHGAAAPQFVLGEPVNGGQVLGGNPDLVNLDDRGDVQFTIDFRRIYSTLLQDWLGLSAADTASVLGGSFETLPLFSASEVGSEDRARFAGLRLAQNSPNPASGTTRIGFTLPRRAHATLRLATADGRDAGVYLDRIMNEGTHSVEIDTRHLPAGAYIYTLHADGFRTSKRMAVLR